MLESYARATQNKEWLVLARERLEKAAEIDPYNVDLAVRLMQVSRDSGDAAGARKWGARALELDGQARLDKETHGLSKSDRAEVEAEAGQAVKSGRGFGGGWGLVAGDPAFAPPCRGVACCSLGGDGEWKRELRANKRQVQAASGWRVCNGAGSEQVRQFPLLLTEVGDCWTWLCLRLSW